MGDDTSETVEVAQSKTTTNYGVYDSPDGDETQDVVGTYITNEITDTLGEYAALDLSAGESDEGLTLTPDRSTSSYGVFSSEAEAVESIYVSHELLERIGADDESSLTLVASPSSESAFNEALDAQTVDEDDAEAEAQSLLAGGETANADETGNSDETVTESDEAEQMVSDDEVGLE